jgi:hypothetical protein
METLNATTVWTRAINGFATETLMGSLSRQPQGTWSVEPVGDNSKLAALRCACRWVLAGPEAACHECGNLLEDPAVDYSPQEPRFGVADRLRHIRPGWLHVGRLRDVPLWAKHRGHYENTWVWVMPDDEDCLADFILVLHDIVTIDVSALYSPPLLVTITRNVSTYLDSRSPTSPAAVPDANKLNPLIPQPPPAKDKGTTLQFTEYRVIRPDKRIEVQERIVSAMQEGKKVDITWQQWMDYTYPYNGTRSNAKIASAPQSAGTTGTTLQQQNLVPPTRNPLLNPPFLGGTVSSPQERARIQELLGK